MSQTEVLSFCIAEHDECEFIYGQGLLISIQGMQVNMPCV